MNDKNGLFLISNVLQAMLLTLKSKRWQQSIKARLVSLHVQCAEIDSCLHEHLGTIPVNWRINVIAHFYFEPIDQLQIVRLIIKLSVYTSLLKSIQPNEEVSHLPILKFELTIAVKQYTFC